MNLEILQAAALDHVTSRDDYGSPQGITNILLATLTGSVTTSGDTATVNITTTGTPTHINSSITTGGTAQTLQAATARTYFYVRNSSIGDMRLTYEGTTPSVSVGVLLRAGEAWENPPHWCPQGDIKIWGATTAQAYEAVSA